MKEPVRDVTSERKTLYYAGAVAMLLGFLLFGSNFCLLPMQMGQLGQVDAKMEAGWFVGRALGGMALIVLGAMLRSVGRLGWAGSGILLDPRQARKDVEPWSRMSGGTLNDALEEVDVVQRLVEPRAPDDPLVKIRCRACQALNDETQKYCGQCGAQL